MVVDHMGINHRVFDSLVVIINPVDAAGFYLCGSTKEDQKHNECLIFVGEDVSSFAG
jgi:hypothetical protein